MSLKRWVKIPKMNKLLSITIILASILFSCKDDRSINTSEVITEQSKEKKENIAELAPNKVRKKEIKIFEDSTERENVENCDSLKKFYWSLDFDTTEYETALLIDSESLRLEIQTFSLNDSSIANDIWIDKENGRNGQLEKAIDISHEQVSRIKIIKNDSTISELMISKFDFEKVLPKEFFKHATIQFIHFIKVENKELYFNGTLNVPDTDWQENVGFKLPVTLNEISIIKIDE
jgi:hypothetical protein